MMREIKFRVWDKEAKIMLESPQAVANLLAKKISGILKANREEERYVFLQYTGINGKDNVKLCEGDIILTSTFEENPTNHYYQIIYNEKRVMFAMKHIKTEWNDSNFMYHVAETLPLSSVLGFNCEKIGNIFQNPELLEVTA